MKVSAGAIQILFCLLFLNQFQVRISFQFVPRLSLQHHISARNSISALHLKTGNGRRGEGDSNDDESSQRKRINRDDFEDFDENDEEEDEIDRRMKSRFPDSTSSDRKRRPKSKTIIKDLNKWEVVNRAVLAGVFVAGIGSGITIDSAINTNPRDLASRDAIGKFGLPAIFHGENLQEVNASSFQRAWKHTDFVLRTFFAHSHINLNYKYYLHS